MNLIIEALFIGLYSSIFGIIPVIGNLYLYLFIIGFFKHLFGYYLGLHDYYCNNNKINKNKFIIYDSILEGLCFIILGNFIFKIFNYNKIISLFITGFSFHIIAEFINLHTFFKYHRCI
jgi:hypothetical protein